MWQHEKIFKEVGMSCDWITVLIIIACIAVGAILGFGKILTVMTNKIIGKIVAVFVCYTFGGIILSFDFMQQLMLKISGWWSGADNFFANFLTTIHLEIIIYYAVLFVAVYWLMKLLAALARAVLEIDLLPVRIINQVCGAVLFTGIAVLVALFVFQIIYWIGGTTAQEFLLKLDGSALGLDKLFENNPLLGLVNLVT